MTQADPFKGKPPQSQRRARHQETGLNTIYEVSQTDGGDALELDRKGV